MKKLRIISLLAVLSLVISVFTGTVFATEADTTGTTSTTDVVSGSDAAADYLSNYELIELAIAPHRMSILVPELDSTFSANSTNADLSAALPNSGLSVEDIINYPDNYGGSITYLFSGSSANSGVMMNVIYTSNNFTQFIGDYNDASEAVLEDIRTSVLTYSGSFPEIRKVNGNTFLFAEGYDSDYGYYSYSMETIVGGGRYQIYIDLADASTADKDIVEEIISSIKIGGFKTTNYGAADKTLATVLLIVVIILAVLVALLTFFVVRFSLFAKAAGSKFNIIGFSMPPSKAELEAMNKKQKKNQSKKNTAASSIVDSISDVD